MIANDALVPILADRSLFPQKLDLHLTVLDSRVVADWQKGWRRRGDGPDFDWQDIYEELQKQPAQHIGFALYAGESLIGLTVGILDRGPRNGGIVSIEGIEGRAERPRILEGVVLASALEVTKRLAQKENCRFQRINNPVEGADTYYASWPGFYFFIDGRGEEYFQRDLHAEQTPRISSARKPAPAERFRRFSFATPCPRPQTAALKPSAARPAPP